MVNGLRTEQDVIAMLGDFGSNDPDLIKKTLNFIPKGFEGRLARLDELTMTLGYYTGDVALYVMYLRENLPAVEGKARQDILVALSENASSRIYQKAPTWQEDDEKRR